MYKLLRRSQCILANGKNIQYGSNLSISRLLKTSSPLYNGTNETINSDTSLVKCDFRHDNKIALVSFNTPSKLNALTVEMGAAFKSVVEELAAKDELRAVVLTGTGRAFSAGGDLDFLIERHQQSIKAEENSRTMVAFYKTFLCLRNLQCPVIAAINGPAIGAGFCVAIGGCDIRIASRKAKMGLNFVKIGLHPGMAATHFLPSLVGPSTAASLLLTGKIINAEEALSSGLVSKICDNPVDEAIQLAEEIAFNSAPMAVKTCLDTLRQRQNKGLEESMQIESKAQAVTYATNDFLEGVMAIKEKRTPNFKGK